MSEDLFRPIRLGDSRVVQQLISQNSELVAGIYQAGDLSWSPLHLVATQGDDTAPGHVEVAGVLLKHGSNVEARDIAGQTPIHLLAVNGSPEALPVAILLRAAGARIDAEDRAGFSPITKAVRLGTMHDFLIEWAAENRTRRS